MPLCGPKSPCGRPCGFHKILASAERAAMAPLGCELCVASCFLETCFPRPRQAHFCKRPATKIKNANLHAKINFFLAFLGPSEFCFPPITCAVLASWTPSEKTKSCVLLKILWGVVPCTLFLKFLWLHIASFSIFLYFSRFCFLFEWQAQF